MKKLIVLGFVVWFGLFFITVFGEKMQDIKYTPLTVKAADVQSSAIVKRNPDFGKVPLYFIPNKGQVNEKARFYAKTSRYTLWMTAEGLVFDSIRSPHSSHSTGLRDVSRLLFLGANKNPGMEPVDVTPHTVNYYKGKNRHEGLRTSEGVVYKNIYNGIYLKVYGIEKELEYDWIINPKGNPQDIRFEYKNVKATHIDSAGNLVVKTAFGKMMHKRPVSYQVIKGVRVSVRSGFKKVGENSYAFDVGRYDNNRELVIDPVITIEYSTYLGGHGSDWGRGIAVDEAGYIYVTGYTDGSDFPLSNAYQQNNSGNLDVFVTKFDPSGANLFFSTYIGSSSNDYGNDIAVSKNGDVFVVGQTNSSDFPVTGTWKGAGEVFVVRFNYKGRLEAGRFFGGDRSDSGTAIALDRSNNVFITGTTYSFNFPTKDPYQDLNKGSGSAFVCKIEPEELHLQYSTFLGGFGADVANDVTVDDSGYFYLTGYTGSPNFPTKNAYQDTHGGKFSDAFVCKFEPDGSDLVFSTYLGGGRREQGNGICVDSQGAIYVAGNTASRNFPLKNAYQSSCGGEHDVFVSKFEPDGSELIYSTYLGGLENDFGQALAVDNSGNIYVAGSTSSWDFPKEDPLQDSLYGSFDGFLSVIASDGSELLYSSFLGGTDDEYCGALTMDNSGNVYLTGTTYSLNFPAKDPYYKSLRGVSDVFVSKFSFSSSPGEETVGEISLDRTRLNFGVCSSGFSTGSQCVLVDNIGSGNLNWTVFYPEPFLRCSPGIGSGSGEVTVWVDGSLFAAGAYTGTITISSPDASNSPQTVDVTMVVYDAVDTSGPIGQFETPVEGTTVSGGIPVTGWALDNIEVTDVKIYREDAPDFVYIGDAVFIEGARPDVEQAYSYYPCSYRAGWGYMLLTNFLPGGGNGTFTLHAIATDTEGHQVSLGSKTITCDNANAVKPFGAIDNPPQGAAISGDGYRNQGWVLTPPPNEIPVNGSTMEVYIDGVSLGNPVYNVYRSDVAALFPGYNNSGGAGAYFDFDTTDYDNGVHTIYWTAIDDAGNAEGIGSRYFTVQNSGISQQASANTPLNGSRSIRSLYPSTPLSYAPVKIKKGYNPAIAPTLFCPDEKGTVNIRIKELERLELHLTPNTQQPARITGYHVIGEQLKPLPIGSTLDSEKGIFYWVPGPGFLGTFQLLFVEAGPNGELNKRFVDIKIIAKFNR